MASAGGTWVKSPNFEVSGKYVFVPAQKPGSGKVKGFFSGGSSSCTGPGMKSRRKWS